MHKTMMTIRSNEDYYDLIESSKTTILVFGENGELWTTEVLKLLEEQDLFVNFFPWSACVELRLQLEVIHYPLVQIWKDGGLLWEHTGYNAEVLKQIFDHI